MYTLLCLLYFTSHRKVLLLGECTHTQHLPVADLWYICACCIAVWSTCWTITAVQGCGGW